MRPPTFSRVALASVILAFSALSPATTLAEAPPKHLDRTHLLEYQKPDGEITPVKTIADWQSRRTAILEAMQKIMGPLPTAAKRCPLDIKIEAEEDHGSYIQRLITYASEPGSRTPAYLLIPKDALAGQRQAPAILCLHPTSATLGFKIVIGQGDKPNRAYARELAERGYVTLAPAYPLLANYNPDLTALGYESGTMKAIWDNIRGLDLLESLPFVKPGGFAAIGHSLGGHNAIYTAVFDNRIKVIVSSSGFDSYLDYMSGDPKRWQAEQGWCQTRYMPKLASYAGRQSEIPFDFYELIGALAPRVCFVNAPLHDGNFQWQSVDRIATAARQVYQLYGEPQRLIVEHPDSEHDFPDAVRQEAYRLLDETLK